MHTSSRCVFCFVARCNLSQHQKKERETWYGTVEHCKYKYCTANFASHFCYFRFLQRAPKVKTREHKALHSDSPRTPLYFLLFHHPPHPSSHPPPTASSHAYQLLHHTAALNRSATPNTPPAKRKKFALFSRFVGVHRIARCEAQSSAQPRVYFSTLHIRLNIHSLSCCGGLGEVVRCAK